MSWSVEPSVHASVAHPPLIPEVGVLAFVPEGWGDDETWMGRHQISTGLSRYFQVVWVNPARGWRTLLSARPQKKESAEDRFPGFRIYDPGPWLPQLYRPRILAGISARARMRGALHSLPLGSCKSVVFCLWRPGFAPVLELDKPDLVVYHIADEYSFSDVEEPISEEELGLIRGAGQVFVHSTALMEKKGGLNPNTAFVPNGVDFQAFARPRSEPEDMRRIPRPRIGYTGVIKHQVDLRLLLELSSKHPSWSFVLIGPQGHLGDHVGWFNELLHRRNVHWLGAKPVEALPAYTQHLDVCLLCYRLNDYTKFIFPLKLHEYLAAGRPVVGSPIRTLQDFAQVISLATTPDEWSSAIEANLGSGALWAEKVAERRRIAQRHDWSLLVRTIAGTICERLGRGSHEQFQALRDHIGADEHVPSTTPPAVG